MRSFHLAAAVLAALFVYSVSPAQAQEPSSEIEWLMVVQGDVVEIDGDRMVIETRPSAVVFSDRPERLVRLINLASFAAFGWGEDGGLVSDPPNASVVNESDGEIAIIVVRDATYADGALTFAFDILSGAAPEVGAAIGVTIDAMPTSVNGQITDAVTQANTKVLGDAPAEAMGNLFGSG